MTTNPTRAGDLPRLAAALSIGCCAFCSAPDYAVPRFDTGDAIEVGLIRQSDSSLELFNANAMAAVDAQVVVLDAGNHRVVALDSLLRPSWSLGSAGAGPNEFGYAMAVQSYGDTLAIGDISNSRIVLMDANQRQTLRTIRAPAAPTAIAWLTGGRIAVPSSSPSHYLLEGGAGETVEPIARRPSGLPVLRDGVNTAIASCGEAVFVFDDDHGTLLRYDYEGQLLDVYGLPDRLQRQLMARRDDALQAFSRQGYRIVGLPLIKQMVVVDCEKVILLFSLEDMFGLMINYLTHTAHPLLLPLPDDWSEPLRSATAVLPTRNGLVVLSRDEVLEYVYR